MPETLMNEKKEEYGSTTDRAEEKSSDVLDLDEVYRRIGRGTTQYLYWLIVGILSIFEFAEITVVSLILPLLTCQWELSHIFQSAVSMSIFVFYAIFSITFGKVTDKMGRKVVLTWSTIVMIGASIGSAFAPNKWVFIVSRSVTGACIGTNLNCMLCYSTEFAESKDRLIGMTIFAIVGSLSSTSAYFLAWLILNYMGWRWLIVMLALPMIPSLALTLILPGSPRYLLVSERQDEAIRAVRFMAKLNEKELPTELNIASPATEDLGSYSIVFGTEYGRSLITLSIIYFCNIFIYFAFILYQPLLFMNGCTSGLTHKSSLQCTSVSQEDLLKLIVSSFPLVVGNILAMICAPFLGRLLTLRLSAFVFIFAAAALLFCVNGTFTVSVVAAINAIGGFMNALIWVIFPEVFPTNIRATATGVINGCGKIGGLLGAGSVSFFYHINHQIVPGLVLTAAILGFLVSLIYNKETRDVVMKDS